MVGTVFVSCIVAKVVFHLAERLDVAPIWFGDIIAACCVVELLY